MSIRLDIIYLLWRGVGTLLLATVSPSSADTEHTLSTLQHVAGIALQHENGEAAGSGAGAESGILQTEATKVRFIHACMHERSMIVVH